MSTVAAQIGNTAWYLTKILHTEGSCDHCGRVVIPSAEQAPRVGSNYALPVSQVGLGV